MWTSGDTTGSAKAARADAAMVRRPRAAEPRLRPICSGEIKGTVSEEESPERTVTTSGTEGAFDAAAMGASTRFGASACVVGAEVRVSVGTVVLSWAAGVSVKTAAALRGGTVFTVSLTATAADWIAAARAEETWRRAEDKAEPKARKSLRVETGVTGSEAKAEFELAPPVEATGLDGWEF